VGPQEGSLPRLTAEDTDPALGYEPPPTLRASDLFPPEVVASRHHEVREEVATDGFFRVYVIDSDFGRFEAAGDVELRQRVQEIRALVALDQLRDVEAYVAAGLTAAAVPFVARWSLVEEPVDTLEGIPPEAWQEVLRVAAMDPDDRTVEETALRRAEIEFEAEKRRLASRLAVNPYSPNRSLQRELNRTGWTLSAGGYALDGVPSLVESSVAPLPEDVLPAELVERLFNNKSPEDLRRRNRIELAVLGVPPDEIEAFLAHPAYSPRLQTGVVEALVALEPARNRVAYVRVAMLAQSYRDAFFRTMGSLILRFHHLNVAPIEELLVLNGRTPAAYTSEGKLIVAAQVDYLLWTRPVDRFVRSLAGAKVPDGRVESREIWLSGEASPTARREIEARGVTVVEGVLKTMVPRLSRAGSAPEKAL
jgi:hypothetical protein